jgi:hypothetical protein
MCLKESLILCLQPPIQILEVRQVMPLQLFLWVRRERDPMGLRLRLWLTIWVRMSMGLGTLRTLILPLILHPRYELFRFF